MKLTVTVLVRCAIQLSPFAKDIREKDWYREDWGWNPDFEAKYRAFEITNVRLFTCPMQSSQFRMGSIPYHLSIKEELASETAKLLLALKYGVNATASMRGQVKEITYVRLKEREKKRNINNY